MRSTSSARPIELGPFDYEQLPDTPSLWIAEGLTTYYGDLAVVRSGVGSAEDFLAGLSGLIRSLQTSPGRLVQTLEESSRRAGAQGSGVGGDRNKTVSYYVKGPIVGWLLDVRIRKITNDRASLDDVMRLAYRRYGGERGFRPEEFVEVLSQVAGDDMSDFTHRLIGTTEELDYAEALDWFGVRFAEGWALEPRPDASDAARRHLQGLMTGRQ
jgi:predicted metalloprotease with PDZ domain